jgi:two-component system, OmpR family, response regulator
MRALNQRPTRAQNALVRPQGSALRILVIEDDEQTATYIVKGLRDNGYAAESVATGPQGLFHATSGQFDFIIVDRMLPELDGLAVIQAMRAAAVSTLVLVLSALGQVDDRISGLKAGADDYLAKPFAFSELLARIEALLRRRTTPSVQTSFSVADLEMDLLARQVKRAGRKIELKPREFKLLEFLMRHAGQIVTRTMLLEGVWDYHFDPQTNVIDVHISRLRQKIDRDFERPLLHTVRGTGFSISQTAPDP